MNKMGSFKTAGIKDKIFIICDYALLILVCLIVIFPLLYVVSASFSDPSAVVNGKVWLWPVNPTLKGYQAVFKNPKILLGFLNSFFYVIVGTTINIGKKRDFRPCGFYYVFQRRPDSHISSCKKSGAAEYQMGASSARGPQPVEHGAVQDLYGKFHTG